MAQSPLARKCALWDLTTSQIPHRNVGSLTPPPHLPHYIAYKSYGLIPCFSRVSPLDKFGTVISQNNVRNSKIVNRLVDSPRLVPHLKFIVDNPDPSFPSPRCIHSCKLNKSSVMFLQPESINTYFYSCSSSIVNELVLSITDKETSLLSLGPSPAPYLVTVSPFDARHVKSIS